MDSTAAENGPVGSVAEEKIEIAGPMAPDARARTESPQESGVDSDHDLVALAEMYDEANPKLKRRNAADNLKASRPLFIQQDGAEGNDVLLANLAEGGIGAKRRKAPLSPRPTKKIRETIVKSRLNNLKEEEEVLEIEVEGGEESGEECVRQDTLGKGDKYVKSLLQIFDLDEPFKCERKDIKMGPYYARSLGMCLRAIQSKIEEDEDYSPSDVRRTLCAYLHIVPYNGYEHVGKGLERKYHLEYDVADLFTLGFRVKYDQLNYFNPERKAIGYEKDPWVEICRAAVEQCFDIVEGTYPVTLGSRIMKMLRAWPTHLRSMMYGVPFVYNQNALASALIDYVKFPSNEELLLKQYLSVLGELIDRWDEISMA